LKQCHIENTINTITVLHSYIQNYTVKQ